MSKSSSICPCKQDQQKRCFKKCLASAVKAMLQDFRIPEDLGEYGVTIEDGDDLTGWEGMIEDVLRRMQDCKAVRRHHVVEELRRRKYRSWRDEVANELDRRDYHNAADRFRNCARAGYTLVCKDCGGEIKPRVFTCNQRVCPSCAKKASNELYLSLRKALQEVMSNGHGGWRLKHVTVTLRKDHGWPGVEDLGRMVQQMGQCVTRLWREYLKRPGTGALAGLEIGPSGNVHAHILYYGPFLDKDDLRAKWEEISGGSYITDVRAIDSWEGAREITKYACKMEALTPEHVADVFQALRGTRRIRTWGVFYNRLSAKPELPECPVCGGQRWDFGRFLHYDEWRVVRCGCEVRAGPIREAA